MAPGSVVATNSIVVRLYKLSYSFWDKLLGNVTVPEVEDHVVELDAYFLQVYEKYGGDFRAYRADEAPLDEETCPPLPDFLARKLAALPTLGAVRDYCEHLNTELAKWEAWDTGEPS